jgi:hypothetical protein
LLLVAASLLLRSASLDDPVARAVIEMVLRYLDSGYGESGRGAQDAAR